MKITGLKQCISWYIAAGSRNYTTVPACKGDNSVEPEREKTPYLVPEALTLLHKAFSFLRKADVSEVLCLRSSFLK